MYKAHRDVFQVLQQRQVNKLCACRHNMPPPARCTHAAVHLQSIVYTPYACGTQRALLHEYFFLSFFQGTAQLQYVEDSEPVTMS